MKFTLVGYKLILGLGILNLVRSFMLMAKEFVSENSHPEVYDSPYNALWRGELKVAKLPYIK